MLVNLGEEAVKIGGGASIDQPDSAPIRASRSTDSTRAVTTRSNCAACISCDPETGTRLAFMTNYFTLPALTIAALYKQRWQVELFFKWIKQHLPFAILSAHPRMR